MRKQFILLLTISIFFVIATATSPDLIESDYDCQVLFENNTIILISESSTDIVDAGLLLTVEPQSVDASYYQLQEYSLEGLTTDTILVSEFLHISDEAPFPTGESPDRFNMSFSTQDTMFSKEHIF